MTVRPRRRDCNPASAFAQSDRCAGVRRSRLRVAPLQAPVMGDVAASAFRLRGALPSPRIGSAFPHLRQSGEAVAGCGDVGMVGIEGFLPDCQCARKQRLRLAIAMGGLV